MRCWTKQSRSEARTDSIDKAALFYIKICSNENCVYIETLRFGLTKVLPDCQRDRNVTFGICSTITKLDQSRRTIRFPIDMR
jgi:hypothetical protein